MFSNAYRRLRNKVDSRFLKTSQKSFVEKVLYYKENPQEFIEDKQFRFLSAGTEYSNLLSGTVEKAFALADNDFEVRLVSHLSLADYRLDKLLNETTRRLNELRTNITNFRRNPRDEISRQGGNLQGSYGSCS